MNGVVALIATINLISYLAPFRVGSFEAGRQLRTLQPELFGLYQLWGVFHTVAMVGLFAAKRWAAWLAAFLTIPYFGSFPIGTAFTLVTCALLGSGNAKDYVGGAKIDVTKTNQRRPRET